jgi:D-proline reductase (dithiol) PrdB
MRFCTRRQQFPQPKESSMNEAVPVMDIEAFRGAYPAWLEGARPALQEKRWKDAFVGYPYVRNGSIPWTPLGKPLRECRLGLFTTAGLYLEGAQQPFDAFNIEGDWSHRIIPLQAAPEQFGIAHDHYDHSAAKSDLNAVFPADRLRELVAEGFLGSVTPSAFSISGYCTRADQIAEVTAPAAVDFFKGAGADVVLLVPV